MLQKRHYDNFALHVDCLRTFQHRLTLGSWATDNPLVLRTDRLSMRAAYFAQGLIAVCREDNDAFNETRFLRACGFLPPVATVTPRPRRRRP